MVFGKGDEVSLKGDPGRRGVITDGPRDGAQGQTYEVFIDGQKAWFDETQLVATAKRVVSFVKHGQFLRDLLVTKLSSPFTDVLYSMGASRTKFLVYQFQPVLKFIQSFPHGVLIADEVGLGKTIEAGLILKELLARGAIHRVLIVCPANLRDKWRSEMQQRFGLEFRYITADDVRSIKRDAEYGGWPDFFGIASLEGLRRDELQEVLEETGIQMDLVIVDEAHHMRNPETLSFGLGETLSDQADYILLLSATPVQTGPLDLLSLLRLIEPAHFRGTTAQELDDLLEPNRYINASLSALSARPLDKGRVVSELLAASKTGFGAAFAENPLFKACLNRLDDGEVLTPEIMAEIRRDIQRLHTLAPYYTRTRKREVEESARRRSRIASIELSDDELSFYDAWIDYISELAAANAPGAPLTWVISMRERQAASSLRAAVRVLPELLTSTSIQDEVESSDPDQVAVPHFFLRSSNALRAKENAVRQAAEKMGSRDTKVDHLITIIEEMLRAKPHRKILLFTFFKGTLRHLRHKLSQAGIDAYAISGDDTPGERADIVTSFKQDRKATVLLSTEVGSEGLDFQFCDSVINFDLPWNPMRVEQRIGRIDRFGQTEPFVDVVSFFVEQTIDTRILERLYRRIRVFEESIGELEPILGPVIQKLQTEVFTSRLSGEEQRQRAEDALHRVETLKIQYREFEAARAELLGQVESAKTSGRYVSGPELHALVSDWLKHTDKSFDSLEPTRRPNVWNLRLSASTAVGILEWTMRERRSDPGATKFLKRLRDDQEAWCTFDSEVAQSFDNLPFVDVSHPIIRVAMEDALRRPPRDALARMTKVQVKLMNDSPEEFLLFLYRLSVSGVEPASSIVSVAVAGDGVILEDLEDEVMGALPEGKDSPTSNVPDDELVLSLEQTAFQNADFRRAQSQQWALETQQARILTRRTAIERSYTARIRRKELLHSRATNERIRRLYEGEMRNLRAAQDSKIGELTAASEPIAALELIAGAVIEFCP